MATEPQETISLMETLGERNEAAAAAFREQSSLTPAALQAFFKRLILETLLECLDGCIADWHQYDPDDEGTVIPMINANTFKARIEEKLWRMKDHHVRP